MRSDRYKNAPTAWYKQFWGWVIIAAFVIGIGGIIITAIFDDGSTKSSNTTTSDTDRITDISKAKGSFDGHTAKLPKYTIKIKNVSIGENDDGQKCMVFDYTAYNKSAKDMSAAGMWEQTFSAYQPNKNTQNQLETDVVDVPDSISDEMNQDINKGGHAKGEYIVVLKSNKRPVTLKAQDENGELIGKHKYSFKAKTTSKNASSKDTTSNNDKQVASGHDNSSGSSSNTSTGDSDSSSQSGDKKNDGKVVIDGHSFHHQNFNDGDNNYDMLVGDNGEGELTEWAVNSPTGQQDPNMQSKVNAIYGAGTQ